MNRCKVHISDVLAPSINIDHIINMYCIYIYIYIRFIFIYIYIYIETIHTNLTAIHEFHWISTTFFHTKTLFQQVDLPAQPQGFQHISRNHIRWDSKLLRLPYVGIKPNKNRMHLIDSIHQKYIITICSLVLGGGCEWIYAKKTCNCP